MRRYAGKPMTIVEIAARDSIKPHETGLKGHVHTWYGKVEFFTHDGHGKPLNHESGGDA